MPTPDTPPLSVLLLSADPRRMGGMTSFTVMLMKNLSNCKAALLPLGGMWEQADGVKRKEGNAAIAARLLIMPFKIARISWRQHFDVIHLNTPFNAKGVIRDGLVLLALRLGGRGRIVIYFHGWQPKVAQRIRHSPFLRFLMARLLNGAARIMVLAPEFKQSLEEIGIEPEKIILTRTMFDGAGLKAGGESPGDSRRSILFMSRFIREKGGYELIEAFSRLAQAFPDTDLVMAGDGPEDAAWRAAAAAHGLKERIQFPGYVEDMQKFHLLRQCTLFALPTTYPEGMPVALLEAMGAGKPVLTARAGGIAHVIREPEHGIVLDAVNIPALEAALRRMLTDPVYCEETGKRNAAYAWERFEATKVAAEIEGVYRNIAQCR